MKQVLIGYTYGDGGRPISLASFLLAINEAGLNMVSCVPTKYSGVPNAWATEAVIIVNVRIDTSDNTKEDLLKIEELKKLL